MACNYSGEAGTPLDTTLTYRPGQLDAMHPHPLQHHPSVRDCSPWACIRTTRHTHDSSIDDVTGQDRKWTAADNPDRLTVSSLTSINGLIAIWPICSYVMLTSKGEYCVTTPAVGANYWRIVVIRSISINTGVTVRYNPEKNANLYTLLQPVFRSWFITSISDIFIDLQHDHQIRLNMFICIWKYFYEWYTNDCLAV